MPVLVTPGHAAWPLVEEETRLLARVQSHLAAVSASGPAGAGDYDRELVDLRDQLAEARLEDVPALIDQMVQAAAIRGQRGMGRALPVDPLAPYFAHLRLREGGKTRDVLVGKRSYVDAESGISIVDWRNAPVSRIYYRYEEGDTYEEEFGKVTREGQVLMRRTLSLQNGQLTRIRTPDATLLRNPQGQWFAMERGEMPELHGGAGAAVRPSRQAEQPSFVKRQKQLGIGDDGTLREDKRLPEIAALIDKAQFDLITRPTAGVVVLQGGAGSGKTTVALHRVAFLHFQDPEKFRPRHMRVLVSQRQLVSYIGRVLPSLDVGETPVLTMDDFMVQLGRQLFSQRRWKFMEDVPDVVSRLKKHPVMLNILEAVADMRQSMVRDDVVEMCRGLPGGEAASARWDAGGRSMHARVTSLFRWLNGGGASGPVQDRLGPYVKGLQEELQNPLELLQDHLSDTALILDTLEEHVPGLFRREEVEALVRWVTRQSQEPEDDSLIDEDARTPVDGGNDGSDPAGKLDEHDLPLLVRLHQLLHGALVPPGKSALEFDHVAVDEAQDLSAIQLQVLADATRHQSITLAGDTAQRLVFDNAFDTWTGLLEHLRIPALSVNTLKVAYRSTREVTEVARFILGPLADPDPPVAPRSGAPVQAFRFSEMGEEVGFMAEQLRGLMARERSANLALICRSPAQADAIFDGLSRSEVPSLRRVADKDFSFMPGIDVTDITQVKGLEYDYVVMAGADEQGYPETLESRHMLHIGATRAAHQLWFTCSRKPSPLIPPDLWETP